MTERPRAAAGALIVAGMCLVTACGGGGAAAPNSAAPQTRPSSTATLSLVSPAQGQVFTSSTVPVKIALHGATIVATTSTNLKPDEGHLHLYLDNQIVSMNYQAQAVLHDVTPGSHVIRVEFVATDHAPFDPRVFVQATFTVKP
jgi:hypothetical protein